MLDHSNLHTATVAAASSDHDTVHTPMQHGHCWQTSALQCTPLTKYPAPGTSAVHHWDTSQASGLARTQGTGMPPVLWAHAHLQHPNLSSQQCVYGDTPAPSGLPNLYTAFPACCGHGLLRAWQPVSQVRVMLGHTHPLQRLNLLGTALWPVKQLAHQGARAEPVLEHAPQCMHYPAMQLQ